MNYRSRIVGTGKAFPEKVMHNKEFESFLTTSDEWIRTRTGIVTRHIADPLKNESTFSLSLEASKKAIEMAKLAGEDIELIIVGTVTPDTVMPTTANCLQGALKATKAFTFDLQAACAGFIYALSIADQYIRSGTVKTALIVGAETLSTLTNWKDRGTCILFGDGAGAAVLTRCDDGKHGVLCTRIYSDGTKGQFLSINHGYAKVPTYSAEYREDEHKIKMQGQEIFKLAVRGMLDSSKQVVEEAGFEMKDVDFFLFHQANLRIIEMCMKQLGVDASKTWLNVDKYGNTSAATLPVCLDEAWKAGKVKEGDLVLMTTFGGGTTWGASLIRL